MAVSHISFSSNNADCRARFHAWNFCSFAELNGPSVQRAKSTVKGKRMSTAQLVVQHLPYLRRYARALTGSQMAGDAYVAATLETLVSEPETIGAVRQRQGRALPGLHANLEFPVGEWPQRADPARSPGGSPPRPDHPAASPGLPPVLPRRLRGRGGRQDPRRRHARRFANSSTKRAASWPPTWPPTSSSSRTSR